MMSELLNTAEKQDLIKVIKLSDAWAKANEGIGLVGLFDGESDGSEDMYKQLLIDILEEDKG